MRKSNFNQAGYVSLRNAGDSGAERVGSHGGPGNPVGRGARIAAVSGLVLHADRYLRQPNRGAANRVD